MVYLAGDERRGGSTAVPLKSTEYYGCMSGHHWWASLHLRNEGVAVGNEFGGGQVGRTCDKWNTLTFALEIGVPEADESSRII